MIRLFYLFLFLAICKEHFATPYRQEGAVVKCCNPKYYSECFAITKRAKRGQPYKTNMTVTTLQPWSNNVTLNISYGIPGYPNMLNLKTKICDVTKLKWIHEYLRIYSNLGNYLLTGCPLGPGYYGIFNMEFPPKDFPLPLPKGDLNVKFVFEQTTTGETMSEITMNLHEL